MKELTIDDAFLAEYGDLISKYIWSKPLEGRDEYDDLYNDVVIKLIENKEKYDSTRGAVSTWIMWVMRTVLHNYFRHKQQDATHSTTTLALDLESDPADREHIGNIITRGEGIGDIDKRMLKDYTYGFTYKELGDRYDISEAVVTVRIHRAKQKLKDQVCGELKEL